MPDHVEPAGVPFTSTLEASSSSSDSVDERRRRGEITCAECRRLKIRCDKKIPCGSCVRRGCGHLCPTETNATPDGLRLVLAATSHLHEDIAALRDRIRVLEEALGFMHRDRTGSIHPLLREQPKDDWGDDTPREVNSPADPQANAQTAPDHNATLVAGTDGTTRFFSSLDDAMVHVMSVANGQPILYGEQHPDYDVELTRCIRHFPFEPFPAPDHEYVLGHLRTYIPSREICDSLLDIVYGECGDALFRAFTPDYVEHSLIPAALYGEGRRGLHALGAFFALLGVGCLFAVPGPGEVPEVRHFGRLSAAAMGAAGVLTHPALELIESLFARAMLELFRQTTLEQAARSSLTLAYQMCYDMGLHMDGANWRSFTPEELHRRKSVFWMVFTTDTFESIAIGRPARIAFDSVYFNIDLLTSTSNVFGEMARMMMLYAEISFAIQSIKAPAYSQVLELDEKARAIFSSPGLDTMRPATLPPPAIINIYLHRAFFSRALTEHPDDPLKSQYSPSVHAALRGAREAFAWLATLLEINPASCSRQFHVWSVALAAATIYTTLLERAPHCPQAKDARPQFENVIPLFMIGAKYGSARAKHSLSVLRARTKSMPDPTQYATQAIRSHLPPPSYPKSEFSVTIKSDPDETISSSTNPVPDDAITSLYPFTPPRSPTRTLKRSASLSSISEQPKPKAGQYSSATDDFYPSYLRRPHRAPTSRSDSIRKFDVKSSLPTPRSLTPRLPPQPSSYVSAGPSALWEGTGWEAMIQTPLGRSSSSGSSASPPENSLTGEWNAVSLGGG